MRFDKKYLIPIFVIFFLSIGLFSCSDSNEDVRMPEDLVGVWSPSDTLYYEMGKDYSVHKLNIEYQDDMSIGLWTIDAYVYEPGYHIVVYLGGVVATVYQIIELSETQLTWCPVEKIDVENAGGTENIGKILGDIIKQAQEGFKTDPELYETLRKIPEDEFLDLIEKLDIDYPW